MTVFARKSMLVIVLFATLAIAGEVLAEATQRAAAMVSLEGTWQLVLDPQDAGIKEKWFALEMNGTNTVQLPGSLQAQGFGEKPSGKTKWTAGMTVGAEKQKRFQPFINEDDWKTVSFLTPKRHYVGPAWYQRTVSIPQNWAGQHIVLHLERVHWQTQVWVDDRFAGMQDSLSTPHVYDLSTLLTPGEHRITLRIDNSMVIAVGVNAHSVSDHTQTAWNGVLGAIRLEKSSAVFRFEDIQLYPDVAKRSVKVVAGWAADKPQSLDGELSIQAESFNGVRVHRPEPKRVPFKAGEAKGRIEIEYPLGDGAPLWDEFTPALYRLNLRMALKDGVTVERQGAFGLREVGVQGGQFMINGRPLFLRGTHEGCIFPKTGYPPTDVEAWKRIIRTCKEYGLNHMRFHSWCPPEAAFQAADELGVYFQVECCTWAAFNFGYDVDKWMPQEAARILNAFGNHPSFALMAAGNEAYLNRSKLKDETARKEEDVRIKEENMRYWNALLASWRKDPRHVYASAAGWIPLTPLRQYDVNYQFRLHYNHMLEQPPQTSRDYRRTFSLPIVTHEMGGWTSYPNFEQIRKYDGFLRPGQLEVARDMLEKAGMLPLAKDFLMASGRFQTLLYKAEIELTLRTPGFGGFQLLGLQDYPGQGLAPVGVLDDFWESKGYVTPQEYRRFCSPTVPLARMKKLTFTNDETLDAAIDVAHYGPAALEVKPAWSLRDSAGKVVASGSLSALKTPTGTVSPMGTISVPLEPFAQAQKLKLEVVLQGTDFANDWEIWVYPAKLDSRVSETKTYVCQRLDGKANELLNAGGAVLLVPKPDELKCDTYGLFPPIQWNRMLSAVKYHTDGILCDPAHPALAAFPTDFHANWQWWELLGGGGKDSNIYLGGIGEQAKLGVDSKGVVEISRPIILTDLGVPIKPIVRSIDDWFVCRDLGLLFEVKAGNGKLMVCSMNIVDNLDKRPVARQLRHSLLKYMESSAFDPKATVGVERIEGLFRHSNQSERSKK